MEYWCNALKRGNFLQPSSPLVSTKESMQAFLFWLFKSAQRAEKNLMPAKMLIQPCSEKMSSIISQMLYALFFKVHIWLRHKGFNGWFHLFVFCNYDPSRVTPPLPQSLSVSEVCCRPVHPVLQCYTQCNLLPYTKEKNLFCDNFSDLFPWCTIQYKYDQVCITEQT